MKVYLLSFALFLYFYAAFLDDFVPDLDNKCKISKFGM